MQLTQSKFHFIGIGGIGMCGLAELLHSMGAVVTGSDPAQNVQVDHLRDIGIEVFAQHCASNLGAADVVVYSSAIRPGHVELEAAKARKIPLIPRAEALAELMRLKRGIAVAGTHGKTTTTSLMASVFLAARQDPTIVVGGRLEALKSTACLGRGPWLLAEADESDGSFSRLSPEIVVITNIDNDHLDHYGRFENLQRAFYDFALQVPFYGLVLVCGDDPVIRQVFVDFPKRVKFYGCGEDNEYRLSRAPGETLWSVSYEGRPLQSFALPMPGTYNALNATAALAVAVEAGLPVDLARIGLEGFAGVDRRVQWKGRFQGADVYDDYGHHPTEVQAVLEGFKQSHPGRRLVVFFQPHRYSRTQLCWSQFLQCFAAADGLWIGDVYAAGEEPREGVSGAELVAAVEHANCRYRATHAGFSDLCEELRGELREGDIFLTLGAGDGWKVGQALVESCEHSIQ